MPAWIHDRAMRIKREGKLDEQYGKEKGKQVAFALATQMAHRLGKSPKKFKSKVTGKMETFGTPQGKREAKMKYDQPLKEYQKTASAASQLAKRVGIGAAIGGGVGAVADKENRLRGAAVGAALGGGAGALASKERIAKALSRKAAGWTRPSPEAVDVAAEKVRQAATGAGGPAMKPSGAKLDEILRKNKMAMFVPPVVTDAALDIMNKQAKLNLKAVGAGLKKGVRKAVGTAPGGANPLNPGSGIKGFVGRIAQPM